MASKAKVIVRTAPTQPEAAVEETDELVDSTREQAIRARAYEIYLERGGQPGHDVDDWIQAEREIESKVLSHS